MKNTITNAKPLNMEERRRLEKIMQEDIDTARSQYRQKMSLKKQAIKETFTGKQVLLLADYKDLSIKLDKVCKELNGKIQKVKDTLSREGVKIDYDYGKHNDIKEYHLSYDYGHSCPAKEKIEQEENKVLAKMEAMKRDFTLKLYAGGTEAVEMFAEIGKQLQEILNS